MKKVLAFVAVLIVTVPCTSQEFPLAEGFTIGKSLEFSTTKSVPSLSRLQPFLALPGLSLREVNFNPRIKREVDLMAEMQAEKLAQEEAYIDLDGPLPSLKSFERSMIRLTNEVRKYDRGADYDIYTGKIKNPAYHELKQDFFRSTHQPYPGRPHASFFLR